MALTSYETLTQALLQAPSSPIPLIATATLDSYINIARNQVAADAECIRVPGTLTLAAGTQSYGFSQIVIAAAFAGVGGVMAVRSGFVQGAPMPLDIRQWEWFSQYYLNDGLQGTPVRAAQQGQGSSGTLYFDPTPNAGLTVNFDVVCLPIALVNNSTVEAIPALFSDAVPFYAAWLGMMGLQRQADADMMLKRYDLIIKRARSEATPSQLPDNLPGGAGAQAAATRQTLAMQMQSR